MKVSNRWRELKSRISLHGATARFVENEAGVASVGAVIWVPFFVSVITLAVDASLLMLSRGDMWRVAGEASRQLAIGSITADEVQQFVDAYAVRGKTYAATVTTTADSVSTLLSVAIRDVSVTAWFTDSEGSVSVEIAHRLEI